MKAKKKGYSALEIALALFIAGMAAWVVWFAFFRQPSHLGIRVASQQVQTWMRAGQALCGPDTGKTHEVILVVGHKGTSLGIVTGQPGNWTIVQELEHLPQEVRIGLPSHVPTTPFPFKTGDEPCWSYHLDASGKWNKGHHIYIPLVAGDECYRVYMNRYGRVYTE